MRYLKGHIYSGDGLQKVLQENFKWAKIKDYNKPNSSSGFSSESLSMDGDLCFENLYSLNQEQITTLIISYDILNRRAIPFNSSESQYRQIPIWEICKASSSAPIYFPPHTMKIENDGLSYEIPMIDGGVVASNPTACAIAEAMKARPDLKKEQFVVVSLGTGDANRPIQIEEVKKWGLVNWERNFTNIFFDGASQAADHIAYNLLKKDQYFRFQAKLQADSLDDVSDKNLNALQAFAHSYFETTICREKLDDLKRALRKSGKVEELKEKLEKTDCKTLRRPQCCHRLPIPT